MTKEQAIKRKAELEAELKQVEEIIQQPEISKEEQWKIHYDYAGNLAYHLGITINGELWEKKALPYLGKFYHITRK